MEGIAMKPPTVPTLASSPPSSGGRKYVTMSSPSEVEIPSTLLLAIISGAVLLLYSLTRIMSLHRRVNDLEARPPVDDIVLRGIIRRQMNEMIEEVDNEKASEQPKVKPSSLKKKEVEKQQQEQPQEESYFPDSFFSKITSNIVDVAPPTPIKSPPDVIRVVEKKVEESDKDSVKSSSSETVEEKMEELQKFKTPPKKSSSKDTPKSKKAPAPVRKIKKRGAKSQNEDEQEALNV